MMPFTYPQQKPDSCNEQQQLWLITLERGRNALDEHLLKFRITATATEVKYSALKKWPNRTIISITRFN